MIFLMTSLYSNENLSIDLVEKIREFGHDVLTSYQAGQANQGIPDDDVFAYATANQRSVVTFNRDDFVALHRRGINHAGIIICKDDRDYLGQAQALELFLSAQASSLHNRLIRVLRQNQPGNSQKLFIIKEYLR
jgi:predicted nuclease of predicted toxin-antitoxin system